MQKGETSPPFARGSEAFDFFNKLLRCNLFVKSGDSLPIIFIAIKTINCHMAINLIGMMSLDFADGRSARIAIGIYQVVKATGEKIMTLNLAERIHNEVRRLPDALAQEVLDFIGHLEFRHGLLEPNHEDQRYHMAESIVAFRGSGKGGGTARLLKERQTDLLREV